MGFLTPLYILGLAAISLPVLFHLIRRTPKGVQPFSSLMFISATPPRLTRRSRLDQILLLILRAAILGLVAFAFARPFLRQFATTDLGDLSQRRFAVLIDTSCSMQREGLWRQVEAELENVLSDLGPQDTVALYRFDADTERVAGFDESSLLAPPERKDLILSRFQQLKPQWRETALGDALITVADDLDALTDDGPTPTLRQLVVISDLQSGSRIESLQGYQWPAQVELVLRPVFSASPDNASLQVLSTAEDQDADQGTRVRVANAADAQSQQFTVAWANATGESLGTALSVSVPPGESRVVRVPAPPVNTTPTHLQLAGDRHDFDNAFYMAQVAPVSGSVVYLGDDTESDPEQMLFYLHRAVTNDPWNPVQIMTEPLSAIPALESGEPLLAIVTKQLDDPIQAALADYLRQGGCGLLVLRDANMASLATTLTGFPLGVETISADDYVLWSKIDFSHRLFRPFANPQFSDFSQMFVWRYCQLRLPTDGPYRTIVEYDNGDAALVEVPVGEGALYILTTSWEPEHSQLARSTKFVPLLVSMLHNSSAITTAMVEVGQGIPLPRLPQTTAIRITKPDGTVVPLERGSDEYSQSDQPGIYQIAWDDQRYGVAVNLARQETQTAPLDIAQLEERGVKQGAGTTYSQEREQMRQMRDIELESTQHAWQWLIAAALVLLITETILAGRWSLRTVAEVPAS